MYERTYHRQVLKDPQEEEKGGARKSPLKKIAIIGSIVLVCFGVGYAVRSPKLQITTVTVEGAEVLDAEEIKISVMDMLSGKALWIFPRTSTLLVQTETLEKKLSHAFSRIQSVTVKRDNAQGLVVQIQEYKGVFLWCETKETCFFMDKNGIVYSDAPIFSGTAYPKIFSGAPKGTLPFSGLSPENLTLITALETQLVRIGITPSEFHFINNRELQVDFLHNKDTARFIVDPTVAVDTSLDYLFSGIRTEPLSGLFHDASKKLLYIDVRYPNNIVYKFEPETNSAGTE